MGSTHVNASLSCALTAGWTKAATPTPALAQFFALFGGHALPALVHTFLHATPHVGTTPAKTVAAKKDAAQRKNSNGLPEGNLAHAKQHRRQPVPQAHHNFPADEDKKRHPQDPRRDHPK